MQEEVGDEVIKGNMFVPIDLLEPIEEDLVSYGRSRRPARPWLGMYTAESDGKLVVRGLVKGGPADEAGVRLGDVVVEVAGGRSARSPSSSATSGRAERRASTCR